MAAVNKFLAVLIMGSVIAAGAPLNAQETDLPTPISSGLSILDVSFGSRSLALGEATQALPGDRFSLFNNPATSALADQTVVIAGVQNMGLVSSSGVIGVFPFKFGTFSVGLKAAVIGDMEIRPYLDDPDYVVGTTAVVAAAPALSFARKFGSFSAGLTLRAQAVSLGLNPYGEGDQFVTNTIGVDIGAYQEFGDLGIGLAIQNLGPRMYFAGEGIDTVISQDNDTSYVPFDDEGTAQPLYAATSVRYALMDNKLQLLGGLGYGSARGLVISAGVEYSPWRILALRLGYNTERASQNPANGISAGLGLQLSNLEIDYSYVYNEYFGASGIHGIDLGFHFGTSAAEKERLLAEARAQAEKEALERQKMTSKTLYDQGITQYNMKRYDDALSNWDLALIWWPDNTDAQNMIEKVNAEKEDMALESLVDQAKQAYVSKNYVSLLVLTNQILGENPAHSLALFYAEEAEKGYTEDLIANSPAQIQEDLRAGVTALQNQDYLTAMRAFEEVLDYDPGNKIVQEYIRNSQDEIDRYISEQLDNINSLIGRSRYAEAKTKVSELLEVAPQSPELLQKLGEIDRKISEDVQSRLQRAQETEDLARSEKELQAALQLDPSNQKAQENLAQVQKAQKKTDQDTQKLYLLGVESYSENNYELAISYWQRVLAIDPNHSNARKNMGRAQAKLDALAGG